MTIVEKAAYLKGLAEGLGVTADSKEGKLFGALQELLTDMAHEIEDLQADHLDLADALDDVAEELNAMEEYCCDLDLPDDMDLFDDEDDPPVFRIVEDEEEEEDDSGEDEDDELIYDGVVYDVTCPVCGEEITLDEDALDEGSIECPGCGETLEFDLSDDE